MDSPSVLLMHSNGIEWAAVREAVRRMPVKLLGEVTNAEDATRLAGRYSPRLIISSSHLEGRSSLPTLLQLQAICKEQCEFVVFVTRSEERDLIGLAGFGQLRPSGLLSWHEIPTGEAISSLLMTILQSDTVIASFSIRDRYLAALRGEFFDNLDGFQISEFEHRLLRERAEGLSYKEIAQRERVSQRTVERVFSCLRDKLDAPDTYVLAMKAALLSLIP